MLSCSDLNENVLLVNAKSSHIYGKLMKIAVEEANLYARVTPSVSEHILWIRCSVSCFFAAKEVEKRRMQSCFLLQIPVWVPSKPYPLEMQDIKLRNNVLEALFPALLNCFIEQSLMWSGGKLILSPLMIVYWQYLASFIQRFTVRTLRLCSVFLTSLAV